MSERSGEVKSGDAVAFDGGSKPHQVVRMIEGTGPAWWNGMKVENGSCLVVVFREQEDGFHQNKIQKAENKTKQVEVDGSRGEGEELR